MAMVELGPAAQRMADLIEGVPDNVLGGPTPCSEYALGDLLDHISGFALAFTAAAKKDTGGMTSGRASGDASRLGDDWRTRIPRDLALLAEAWRDPAAWTGMTWAGGIDLPGELAGIIALDELVIHGWDVARASGQDFDGDRESLEAVHRLVNQFSGAGQEAAREGMFGPEVPVPDDAPLLDRIIGLTGRDPGWSPLTAALTPTHEEHRMDWKLELVAVPVSDVDRAKDFYTEKAGFNVDHDHAVSDEIRFVQLTPPGSACSIAFGKGITAVTPGSAQGLQMVVDDVEAARGELMGRGVEASEIQDFPWGRFVFFSDPDGNGWAVQQLPARD
jgi:uncharacterized protein (TIGR03086 family)